MSTGYDPNNELQALPTWPGLAVGPGKGQVDPDLTFIASAPWPPAAPDGRFSGVVPSGAIATDVG
jgi:hypothetical protein